MHESEAEAYQRIKDGQKTRQPKDDGTDRRKNKDPKEKAAKKALKASNRGALNSSNMHYHDDEKMIVQYYRSKFIEKVIAEKGEISIVDEMLIDLLSYAAVRVFRKARMESMFGRFMDRTAPQDPVAQILSCIKSLGLKNNLKGGESGKEMISKLLGSDAEEMNGETPTLSLEQWREAETAKGGMKIERRAMTDFAEDESFYKTPEQLAKEDEDAMNGESQVFEL